MPERRIFKNLHSEIKQVCSKVAAIFDFQHVQNHMPEGTIQFLLMYNFGSKSYRDKT
jgi:hypothetical protein